jgi:hypothetical protein
LGRGNEKPRPNRVPKSPRSYSGFLKPTLSENVPRCFLKRPEPPQAMLNQLPVSARRQPFAKRLRVRVFGASDGGRDSFPAEERDHPASATPPGLREPPRTQPNPPAFFSMAGETPGLPIFMWPAVRPLFDSRDSRLGIIPNNPRLEHIPTPPSHPAQGAEIPQPGPQGRVIKQNRLRAVSPPFLPSALPEALGVKERGRRSPVECEAYSTRLAHNDPTLWAGRPHSLTSRQTRFPTPNLTPHFYP